MNKQIYKGYEITINQSDYANSPREWDNLGVMITRHREYNIGEEDLKKYFDEYGDNAEAEAVKNIKEKYNPVVMLPLYLYDHSGLNLSTGRICKWDSSYIGFIVAPREAVLKEYNVKKITKKIIEKVTEVLNAEVEVMNQYISGDVYSYITEFDSCGGIYGYDEALQLAKESIDYGIEREQKEKQKKLKTLIKNHVSFDKRVQLLAV